MNLKKNENPLVTEMNLLKDRELIYKHSETGSGMISLADALRSLERLEVALLNHYNIPNELRGNN